MARTFCKNILCLILWNFPLSSTFQFFSNLDIQIYNKIAFQINLAKEQGLVIFCWGDDNNCKDTIKYLKDLGIHGVIYDKMDVLSSKGTRVSFFLVFWYYSIFWLAFAKSVICTSNRFE